MNAKTMNQVISCSEPHRHLVVEEMSVEILNRIKENEVEVR